MSKKGNYDRNIAKSVSLALTFIFGPVAVVFITLVPKIIGYSVLAVIVLAILLWIYLSSKES